MLVNISWACIMAMALRTQSSSVQQQSTSLQLLVAVQIAIRQHENWPVTFSLEGRHAHGKTCSSCLTCHAEGGMFVTPGSKGHGPKSYLLQKECAAFGATNTKQSNVCFSDSSSCSMLIRGRTSCTPSFCRCAAELDKLRNSGSSTSNDASMTRIQIKSTHLKYLFDELAVFVWSQVTNRGNLHAKPCSSNHEIGVATNLP